MSIVVSLQIRCRNSVANRTFHTFLIIAALFSPMPANIPFSAKNGRYPIVIELIGVFSIVPKILMLRCAMHCPIRSDVVEFRREPGSLNAILPTRPIPSRAMSMPPKLSMRCSYRRQYSKMVSFGDSSVGE